MKEKYKNIDKSSFIICLSVPETGIIAYNAASMRTEEGVFTINKKYKIIEYLNEFQINIFDDNGNLVKFNLWAPFGENFCTLAYLRSEKLKKIKCI